MTEQTPRTTEERTPRTPSGRQLVEDEPRVVLGPHLMLDRVLAIEREAWMQGIEASGMEREAAAATPSLPDEWLLSISMMEAARRIDMEIPVGHSWRERAMMTNVILADQYRAASSGPSKGEVDG